MKFNHLNVPDSWRHYWTKYPEGYTVMEALISWVSQVDGMVDNVNNWNIYLDDFKAQFDSELQTTVTDILEDWNTSGFLQSLINTYTNERIDTVEIAMATKVDKTGVGQVSWGNLSQEAKENIAGGTTAVVGENSVGAVNVIDESLPITKLDTGLTDPTINVFNKYTAFSGYLETAGNIAPNSTLMTSQRIPVKAGDKVYLTEVRTLGQYGLEGEWLPDMFVNEPGYALNYELTVLPGVSEIAVSFRASKIHDFMVTINTALPPQYEPYRMLSMQYMPYEAINKKVEDKYFERTLNMFDNTTFSEGYLELNGYIRPNANLVTTHKIPVNTGDVVNITQVRTLAHYDSNGLFLPNRYIVETDYPSPYSITIPEGTKTIAISFQKDLLDKFMVTINEPLGSYKPYVKLKDQYIGSIDSEITEIGGVNLPPKLYATVGEELTILHKNITREEDHQLDYNGSVGNQLEDRYTHTFTSAGTNNLTVGVYDKGELLDTQTVSVISSNPITTNKRVLLIGDSTVNSNGTGEISRNIKNALGDNITLLGTRGTAPYLHEGRGGWTAQRYNTNASYEDVVNPFYNPNTQGFDLSYYLTQTGQQAPDIVIFQLGINDTFTTLNIESVQANFDVLINSIKATNPSVKVALNITIPPNDSQNIFSAVYGLGQTQWRYKYHNFDWVQAMIDYYSGSVDLISTHISIDTTSDFADGVHPNNTGYKKMSTQVIAYLNAQ